MNYTNVKGPASGEGTSQKQAEGLNVRGLKRFAAIALGLALLSVLGFVGIDATPSAQAHQLAWDSPVPLKAPWRSGDQWVANGSFYGEGGHTDYYNGVHVNDHYAVDWNKRYTSCNGDLGQQVLAPASGRISTARANDPGAWTGGRIIKMGLTANMSVEVSFLHLNAVYVSAGQTVSAGQLIGTVGNSGLPAGYCAHLHMSVRQNVGGVWYSIRPGPLSGQAVYKNAVVTSNNTLTSTVTAANRLLSGQQLLPGQSITSTNGCFRFIYQTDGNLVLYRMSGYQPLWASNTSGRSARNAIMQTDGNLVIYDASGTPVWSSRTSGNSGSWLIVQSDGNVVIYRPNGGPAIWATNTVRTC